MHTESLVQFVDPQHIELHSRRVVVFGTKKQ